MSHITDQDIAALKLNEEKWDGFCLNEDWDKCLVMLTEDVVFIPPDGPVLEGKDAVKGWLEKFPPIKAMTSKIVHTEGRDDFACARGTTAMTLESEPGKTILMNLRWFCSFRKQPDSSWKYASLLWNVDS